MARRGNARLAGGSLDPIGSTAPDADRRLSDNEVDATHPLAGKLEVVKNAGAQIEEITLAPLASEHLAQLIADALRCEPERRCAARATGA